MFPTIFTNRSIMYHYGIAFLGVLIYWKKIIVNRTISFFPLFIEAKKKKLALQ